MKKIEKFYQDHKDEVIVALGTMTAVAGVIALTYINKVDGMKIKRGGMTDESENTFCVELKNGRHHHFNRPPVVE